MTKNKKTARLVGLLFITGTVAGALSAVITAPVFSSQDYLAKTAANEALLIAGALLVLVMAFSLAMIPVVLFPLFRKYNEILAFGAVLFRGALEAVAYIAVALTWLGLVTVSREFAGSGAENAASLTHIGTLLVGLEDWSAHIVSIVFSIGALMVYWLFYISKLIPGWLSAWGLAGALLYLAAPLLDIIGLEGFAVLMAPLAIQEMVLAIWLIINGFNAQVTTPASDRPVQ